MSDQNKNLVALNAMVEQLLADHPEGHKAYFFEGKLVVVLPPDEPAEEHPVMQPVIEKMRATPGPHEFCVFVLSRESRRGIRRHRSRGSGSP